MNERKLKFKYIDSIESLKYSILVKLKIIDFNKDCLSEFEIRLRRYLERNPGQVIRLVIDMEDIKQTIKSRVAARVTTIRYPDGFKAGQPHMMWGVYSDPRPQSEIEEEKLKIGLLYDEELARFQSGLPNLLKIGNGQILLES